MNDNNLVSDVANFGARAQQFYQVLTEEWRAAVNEMKGNEDNEALQEKAQVLSDLCDYYLEVFEDIVVT